jgi:DNA-directed RNA polymerase specialized sigma24 family protein
MRERGSHELPTADDLGGASTAGDEAEAHLDAAACRAAVTRALDSLPPRHRDLMRALFDEAAGSYHEIARDLGIPVGSIGPIRGRCLEQLRRNAHLAGGRGVRLVAERAARVRRAARFGSGRDVEPELPRA